MSVGVLALETIPFSWLFNTGDFLGTLGKIPEVPAMLPPLNLELTLPQELDLERMRRALPEMSEQQAKELLLQAAQVLMVKDNVIRQLARK